MENKRQTLSRPLASHLRHQSMGAPSSGASPVLLARINEKKAELANLKELQALSAGLADQMEMLEQKLSTLSDGTEAVAAVLSNWHNVLRAINMASMKIPKPKDTEEPEAQEESKEEVPLPQTLVRIPTQHAPTLLQQTGSGNAATE
ncbi:putative dash complex subunit dad2 protein [Neofusicoccum parvum UCRNP2]|uniref:DASH complex subunit DAD2 n=1 Tax=Botryosphaeria parva (strain UCR-NP2) TaxID=1287680 RepID=R1GFA6_BOTPV|nr:putative dash complex subunit dad2 protein [Neofusicoccum parvum UCRNP2]